MHEISSVLTRPFSSIFFRLRFYSIGADWRDSESWSDVCFPALSVSSSQRTLTGILQFHLILILSARRSHQTPQFKGSVPPDGPPLQKPILNLGCHPCFWPNGHKSEVPTIRSLDLSNLVEQLTRLREIFTNAYQFIMGFPGGSGEGSGTPLQSSCLENPRDGGAWWAAVCGVAQSRTRLKWPSSCSGVRQHPPPLRSILWQALVTARVSSWNDFSDYLVFLACLPHENVSQWQGPCLSICCSIPAPDITTGHIVGAQLWTDWGTHKVVVRIACVNTKPLQSCPTLCDPMDWIPPGSSVHGILQVRILEWVAVPSSRGSSWPRDRTHVSYVSCIGRQVLYPWCHLGSLLWGLNVC